MRVVGLVGLVTSVAVAVPIASLTEFGIATSGPPREAESSSRTPANIQRSPATESSTAAEAPADIRRNQPLQPAPTAEPVPETGPGTFRVALAAPDEAEGATTYRVEVEHGLPFAPADVARFVEETLTDERGWSGTAGHRLVRIQGGADLRIVLASPETADALCAPLETGGRLSCRNGSNVVINAWRWRHGADSYDNALIAYRRYVVNHETGHALGHPHAACPEANEPAPVMLQQTLGLDGCQPNPWPNEADQRAASH